MTGTPELENRGTRFVSNYSQEVAAAWHSDLTMALQDLFPKTGLPVLSPAERSKMHILIVESELSIRIQLRQTLGGLGFSSISEAPNHALALQKLVERHVTHVIFEAKKTNMPAADFLTAVLSCDEKIIALPSSYEPSVDDVFNLLIIGARGYIVKPFTEDAIDEAVIMATKGEAISDAILFAKDRNEALVSLMMTALDKLSTTLKQARHFETAKRELPRRVMNFKRAIEISKLFAQGGKPQLLEALLNFCIERSNGPASRLGRLRKRLGERKHNGKLSDLEEQQEGEQDPAADPSSRSS